MGEVHPLIAELDKKRKEKGMSLRETAELVKITYSAVYAWLYTDGKPRKKSLEKVRTAIKKIDNDEWQPLKKEVNHVFRYKNLPKNISIEQRTMYNQIQALEAKYGDLASVPENDEDLNNIRKWAE